MNDHNIENVRFHVYKVTNPTRSIVTPSYLSYFNKNLDEPTLLRLNDDSNDRYLQARVGNTPYNLQIYNKAQIIDTTIIQSR